MDHRSRTRLRPRFESLEGRSCPATDFTSALAIGATGSFADIKINAVAQDEGGNAFVTGSFRGTVDFDPGVATVSRSSQGNRDAFVASYALDGSLRWVSIFAGANAQTVGQGSAVGLDGAGSLYVTGTFNGTVDFDPGVSATNLSAPARNDIFVVKLDGSGGLTWARSVVGSSGATDEGFALAVDSTRGVVVGGSFNSSATFGASVQTAAGSSEAFVTKLDASGSFLWTSATRGAGNSTAEIRGLTVDATGQVFAVGFVSGAVDFDPGPGVSSLTSNGIRDIAVWALGASGGLSWARSMGGADVDQAQAVALDDSGLLAVVGSFSGSVDFDPGPATLSLTATGLFDPFLLRLSPSGATLAAYDLSLSSNGTGEANGVAIDGAGRVYTSGWFTGTLDTDPGPGRLDLVSAGSADVFVVAIDSAGTLLDARRGGGANFDASFGLAIDGSGRLSLAGTAAGPATFGVTTLQGVGASSVFVGRLLASYGPASLPAPKLQAASDTGASSADGVTLNNRPTFDLTGVAPGNEARLLRDGVVVASRIGPGAIVDPGPAAEGARAYSTIQIVGGVPTGPSPALVVTIDTIAPAPPSAPALAASSDSGAIGDRRTKVQRPTLVGSAEAGSTVTLRDSGGNLFGVGLAGSDGLYIITLSSPLADGTYTIGATSTDLAGNVSGPASSTFVIDATAPAAPSTLSLLASDDSGIPGDLITRFAAPRLVGTSEPNAIVNLYDESGTMRGQATATSAGAFEVRISPALAGGVYQLLARATDAAGNIGPAGPIVVLSIDLTAPPSPTAPRLLVADDSGTLNDGITNVARPRMIGTAEAGSKVELIDGSNVVIGTATADSQGAYQVGLASSLADGAYSLRVRATDAAGNVGPNSPVGPITIDTKPPATPGVPSLFAADDSGLKGDHLTNVRKPRLTGQAEPLSIVRLIDGSEATIAQGQTLADSTYTLTPVANLPEGTVTLRIIATDAAGNASVASTALVLTIDATAPVIPTGLAPLSADDSGTAGDRITNVRQPRYSGKSEPGASILLVGIAGSTSAASDGSFTIRPTSPLADGLYQISVVASDAAGNTSAASLSVGLTIDGTPPAVPTNLALLVADDSGTIGDGITNVRQPRLSGRGEAGTIVTLSGASGSATVAGDGSFVLRISSSLADGTYSLSAKATDAAGNVSPTSSTISLRVLATSPPAPSLSIFSGDDTGLIGDRVTAVRRPRFSGTAPPGSTVELLNPSGSVIGSAVVASDGSFRVAPGAAFGLGLASVTARVRDQAGNLGAAGPRLDLRLIAPLGDFSGSGLSSFAVFDPRNGNWTTLTPGASTATVKAFGTGGMDRPMVDDFDGDGKADYVAFRPSTSEWSIFSSLAQNSTVQQFGWAGVDLPIPADYDGDGRADLAVFRPNTAEWFVSLSGGGSMSASFGAPNLDLPMPADYDGDGRADLAVYRPNTAEWFVRRSSDGGPIVQAFGWAGVDLPIPADYDGDGKADFAVYRPTTSDWFIRPSGGVDNPSRQFGWAGVDLPIPADYDGDGKTDLAVFRPNTAEFFVSRSGGGTGPPPVLGPAEIVIPVLRPQVYRLDGLRPKPASVPVALVVGRPATLRADIPPAPVKIQWATARAPVVPKARPIVRPAQSPRSGLGGELPLGSRSYGVTRGRLDRPEGADG